MSTTPPQIEWLAHEDILPSSLNPRTHYDPQKLEDLQASFKAHGFDPAMSHLLVRVHPEQAGKFELICGERRWRAAGALGLATVPGVVKGMSDLEVLEKQLVENLQRADLTPLEEAEGYRRTLALRKADGEPEHTVKSLAAKLGISAQLVAERISLCRLRGTWTGEALEAGDLTISHARLLARLPDRKQRDALAKRVVEQAWSKITLESEIKNSVMTELRGAEFDANDASLVPMRVDDAGERFAGGACSDCPFNTKNIQGETGKMHLCMHPECFREKKIAAHAAWQASVVKPGVEALDLEAVEKLFDYTGKRLAWNSSHVELKETPPLHELKEGIDKPETWRRLIKGQGVPIVLAKDRDGVVHELVSRELAVSAAKAAGHEIFRKKESGGGLARKSQDALREESLTRRREREKMARASRMLERELMAAAGSAKKIGQEFWLLLIEALMGAAESHGSIGECCATLGQDGATEEPAEVCVDWLEKHTEKLPAEKLPGVALLLARATFYEGSEEEEVWTKRACKLLGVDAKAVAKRVAAEIAAEEKQKAEAEEIAEGMCWVSRREKVAEFEWDGNAAVNPDVCEVKLPSDVRQTVSIFAARGKTGWHAGWKIVNGKAVQEEPVVKQPPDYGTRELAVKAALLALLDHFTEAKLPAAQGRMEAYIALISTPAPTGKKKGGRK